MTAVDHEHSEELWLEEIGNPYHAMVATAVDERVVAAAICWPGDSWMRVFSTPVRRLIRRMRGEGRWDDRLSAGGWRPSLVALTDRSLLVFEFRVSRKAGEDLGPCLGRWRRDDISLDARRTVLERSSLNSGSAYDSLGTDRTRVLRLTGSTPDGRLELDLPVEGQPGISEFERALARTAARN